MTALLGGSVDGVDDVADDGLDDTPGQRLRRLLPTFGLASFALWMAYLSSAVTPWNGLAVLGLRPGDLLAFASLLAFGLADLGARWPRLPGWAWTFGALIVLTTVLHEMLPINPDYLNGRTVVDAVGQPTIEVFTNMSVGAKFLVPIIGLPFMYGFCAMHDRRSLMRAAIAYSIGSAISAVVAFSDSLGLSDIGPSLTTVNGGSGGRTAGFTVHPNFLAASCVIGAAVSLWLIAQRPRLRVLGLVLLLAMLLGIYASGSRGGGAVLALTLALSVVVLPQFRRHLSSIALATGVGVAILFVAVPNVGTGLLTTLRLVNGGTSVEGSDQVRAIVHAQGWADFHESPIYGVGMQVAEEAHNVYLQALAAGGLLLLAGFVVFLVGAIVMSIRWRARDPFARALILATVSSSVLSSLENSLTDRLVYVPMALIAALPNLGRDESGAPQPEAPAAD